MFPRVSYVPMVNSMGTGVTHMTSIDVMCTAASTLIRHRIICMGMSIQFSGNGNLSMRSSQSLGMNSVKMFSRAHVRNFGLWYRMLLCF